jgi:hypothetical protein
MLVQAPARKAKDRSQRFYLFAHRMNGCCLVWLSEAFQRFSHMATANPAQAMTKRFFGFHLRAHIKQ